MCQYCESRGNNDFLLLNQTKDYSGIEIASDRQGMLRTRYYGDNDIWFSQEIVNIKFCPMCGRKL